MKTIILLSIILAVFTTLSAQENKKNDNLYEYPEDPLVAQKLDEWQDLKFGLLMHWGLYAQIGIVESWGLCSEDQGFQDRRGMNYTDFKEMYFGLIEEFNPQKFDPEPWAKAAKDAGMKYVVFTTKHHDGFCMFDTDETDFKITSEDSPFHKNPKANIAREIFSAFRDEGFMIGAYFSKADWHCPYYWTPLLATPDRSNNYDIKKYPERWQQFKDFTYNQIEELTTDYGQLDILWLDGGWVRPDSTINEEVLSWGYRIPDWEQDIDMPRVVDMARKNQPGLIVVDRTVHGPYENYRTPEQSIPKDILPFPFETNMTMTQSWGHTFNPNYKSAKKLIHTMIDVVSKGGNFLLNVGPTPEGTFEEEAYKRLIEIGDWMKVNGAAIYGSRAWKKYGEGDNIRYTVRKDCKFVNVFLLDWPGNILQLPNRLDDDVKSITLMGYPDELRYEIEDEEISIILPESFQDTEKRPCNYAWVIRIELK